MNAARSDDPRMLLLETSSRVGWVAVTHGSEILGQRRLDESRRHARDLAPAVASLCAAQGWRVRDLDGVVVSIGPGSYTGLRVGLTSAKTLAYATGCVLLKVPTFRALVTQMPSEVGLVDLLADAQPPKLYVQRFIRRADGWSEGELRVVEVEEWLGAVSPDVWVTGPGLAVVEPRLPPEIRAIREGGAELRPESLLKVGLDRWRRGETDDPWTLEPLYLRPSNAEEKWPERQQAP